MTPSKKVATTMFEILHHWVRHQLTARLAADGERDRGATVVETVIITAAFAALAVAVMGVIVALVNGKVAGIHL
jgi:hypothetical protein